MCRDTNVARIFVLIAKEVNSPAVLIRGIIVPHRRFDLSFEISKVSALVVERNLSHPFV